MRRKIANRKIEKLANQGKNEKLKNWKFESKKLCYLRYKDDGSSVEITVDQFFVAKLATLSRFKNVSEIHPNVIYEATFQATVCCPQIPPLISKSS